MSRNIYIDYENHTYYVTEEELHAIFIEEYEAPSFDEWLNNNYTASEIFEMTERERAKSMMNLMNIMKNVSVNG